MPTYVPTASNAARGRLLGGRSRYAPTTPLLITMHFGLNSLFRRVVNNSAMCALLLRVIYIERWQNNKRHCRDIKYNPTLILTTRHSSAKKIQVEEK